MDKFDPKLGIAMQLLNERTGQVIDLGAQVQALNDRLRALEAENAKLKVEATDDRPAAGK